MMNDKQTEIEEMVKDLDEIYNTDFKGDYESGLKDMASRLCAKGYRKSQDVAEEIFAEIEKIVAKEIRRCDSMRERDIDYPIYWEGGRHSLQQARYWFAELKKKYESEKDNA